jgi:hypothetical protein
VHTMDTHVRNLTRHYEELLARRQSLKQLRRTKLEEEPVA